jgi:hypothetical protein
MAQIFVSYSRKDTEIVDRLLVELYEASHEVWIDRAGIRGGKQWRQQIVTAIDNSDILLLILSPNSIKSDNVRKELDLAEGVKKRVLPIVVEPIKSIPNEMRYQLVGLQRLDLSDDFETGLDQLLEALKDTDYKESGVPDSVHKPRNTNSIIIISIVVVVVIIVALILSVGIFIYLIPNSDEAVTPAGSDIGGVTTTAEQSGTPRQTENDPEATTNLQTAIETALAETRQAEATTSEVVEPPPMTPTAIVPSPTVAQLPQPDISTATPSPTPAIPTNTPTPEPPAIPTPEAGLVVDNFEDFSGSLDDIFEINRNAGNEGQLNLIGIPHVSEGRQALALMFNIQHSPPDHYIGFDRTLPPQDWSKFTSLCFWIESDGSNRSLVLQFGESKFNYWKKVYTLSNGTGDYCISLNDPHQINLRAVGYYGVYVEGPPTGQSIIYIDNIRLVDQ